MVVQQRVWSAWCHSSTSAYGRCQGSARHCTVFAQCAARAFCPRPAAHNGRKPAREAGARRRALDGQPRRSGEAGLSRRRRTPRRERLACYAASAQGRPPAPREPAGCSVATRCFRLAGSAVQPCNPPPALRAMRGAALHVARSIAEAGACSPASLGRRSDVGGVQRCNRVSAVRTRRGARLHLGAPGPELDRCSTETSTQRRRRREQCPSAVRALPGGARMCDRTERFAPFRSHPWRIDVVRPPG